MKFVLATEFTLNSESFSNVKLLIDDQEYLMNHCEKYDIEGFLHGNYLGSSTRISGGEIWHPNKGFSIIKITLQINLNNEWVTIFDRIINCQEEMIKYFNAIFTENISNLSLEDENGLEFLKEFEKEKNICIQNAIEGKLVNFSPFIGIRLENEQCQIELHLRYLYRFSGEVQISGCTYKMLNN